MHLQHKPLPRITVVCPYENEYGYQEVYSPGFLTSENYAIYLAADTQEIVVTEVVPSREPAVYIGNSVYLPLGTLYPSDDAETVINVITTRLKEMTAYDLVTKVLVNVWESFDFGKLIIPGLLRKEH